MRRSIAAWGICAMVAGAWITAGAVGCGIDVLGTQPLSALPGADAGEGSANLPSLDGGISTEGGSPDGGLDGAVDASGDAESMRPDAGVPFDPTHIQPVYSLSAADVIVGPAVTYSVDTVTLTYSDGVSTGNVANMVISNGVAVWSVGTLSVPLTATLVVTGANPLVIVASKDVDIDGTIDAAAKGPTPGPGGSAPGSGAGKGGKGGKSGTDAAGGGGAGHATIGGLGGVLNAAAGGLAGLLNNANDAVLIGGSGGGNGGNYPVAVATCMTAGQGGGGGGAIQISAVGKITISDTGEIDVSGGGGTGGCSKVPGYTGGGGGGAGGLVVLEAVAGVEIDSGAVIAAAGGGGAQGGASGFNGDDGENGQDDGTVAKGGGATNNLHAGNGGNGGVGKGLAAGTPPQPGLTDSTGGAKDASGGGGASHGRVFLGTRGASNLDVASGSKIYALRMDYTF